MSAKAQDKSGVVTGDFIKHKAYKSLYPDISNIKIIDNKIIRDSDNKLYYNLIIPCGRQLKGGPCKGLDGTSAAVRYCTSCRMEMKMEEMKSLGRCVYRQPGSDGRATPMCGMVAAPEIGVDRSLCRLHRILVDEL